MADIVRVQLLRGNQVYNAGEIIGVSQEYAARLLQQEAAVVIVEAPHESPHAAECPRATTKSDDVDIDLTAEQELWHLDLTTKSEHEQDMKKKDLKQPPKDKMMRPQQGVTK